SVRGTRDARLNRGRVGGDDWRSFQLATQRLGPFRGGDGDGGRARRRPRRREDREEAEHRDGNARAHRPIVVAEATAGGYRTGPASVGSNADASVKLAVQAIGPRGHTLNSTVVVSARPSARWSVTVHSDSYSPSTHTTPSHDE